MVFRDAHFAAAATLIKRLFAAVSQQPFNGPYRRLDVTCWISWAIFRFRYDQAHALLMQQVLALADERCIAPRMRLAIAPIPPRRMAT
jgi:hypothetical protein